MLNEKYGDNNKVHCFITDFMTMLIPGNSLENYSYGEVMRWTGKRIPSINILNFNKLLFPANISNSHWTLLEVNIIDKAVKIIDSIACHPIAMVFAHAILRWLGDELKTKHKVSLPDDWKIVDMGMEVPQQTNNYDCGVYVMVNAGLLCAEKQLDYSNNDMIYFRSKIKHNIIGGTLGCDTDQTESSSKTATDPATFFLASLVTKKPNGIAVKDGGIATIGNKEYFFQLEPRDILSSKKSNTFHFLCRELLERLGIPSRGLYSYETHSGKKSFMQTFCNS
jgi:hypothetical protein